MVYLTRLALCSTFILSALASPTHQHDDESTSWRTFQKLLDSVDEGSLHRVLHAVYPKFQDGIFSKDRTALEHVHSEDPVMASKLVHIAKRQANNGTIPTTTSDAVSPTPSTPEQTSQAEASSSAAASVSSALSSALSSAITASNVPSPTTVLVAPSSPESATPVSTGDGGVVYSTRGGGVLTLTSSAVSVRFTPSTSTRLFYTTETDGKVQTRTSLVVVNAPVTATADPTGAAGVAQTSSAGLQNAANRQQANGFGAACVAALGFYVAM